MTDKASPAGWVVQVTTPPPIAPSSIRWIGAAVLSAPSFQYFNVAIADPNKAIEATSRHLAKPEHGETRVVSVVRKLSAREIDALNLTAGEVKPA
jgi:hypothetical protein